MQIAVFLACCGGSSTGARASLLTGEGLAQLLGSPSESRSFWAYCDEDRRVSEGSSGGEVSVEVS